MVKKQKRINRKIKDKNWEDKSFESTSFKNQAVQTPRKLCVACPSGRRVSVPACR
jgi:hypothetical protein